ncbi:MAG TPA: tetratricopeptide repeat protein [Kofleriaceae bacterium]|nr:tetratricopeptide repeat protein [Kofleriaceae bacterium]
MKLAVGLALLAACGGQAAAPNKPAPASCGGALGVQEEPLLAGWSKEQRAALATAMQRGLVAVAYTCGSLHIVDGCSAPGRYGHVAVTPHSLGVSLDTADEAIANAPGLAWTHPVQLGDTVTGRSTTIYKQLARAELQGKCAGATHFVEAVEDGASGPLRLHVTEIDSDAVETEAAVPLAPCGAGRVWRDNKCAAPSSRPHQCRLVDIHDCEQQCTAGHAGSCTTLALALAAGEGAGKDEKRSIELLQRACKQGDAMACRHTADLLASGESLPADIPRAVELFGHSCDAGLGTACSYLGALVEAGRGITADHARALTLFERACDAGYARGCQNLAIALTRDGKPEQVTRALALLGDGCAAGDLTSCTDLAVVLAQGAPPPADLARAVAAMERACTPKHPAACGGLGLLLVTGIGVHRDETRGVKLLHDACDGDDDNACNVLANYDLAMATSGGFGAVLVARQKACTGGDGGSCRELVAVRALFSAQCADGTQLACSNLAQLVIEGIGGAKDETQARTLMQRACDSKVETSCQSLAVLMIRGQGGPVDVAGGMAMLRAGCKGKSVERCVMLGAMLQGGNGVPADPKQARAAFDTGCSGDNVEACEAAGVAWFGEKDRAKAIARFEHGCKLGSQSSCSKQGEILVGGNAREHARGLELLRTGCKAGESVACDALHQLGEN